MQFTVNVDRLRKFNLSLPGKNDILNQEFKTHKKMKLKIKFQMKLKMFKFGNFEENVALQHLFFIKETK